MTLRFFAIVHYEILFSQEERVFLSCDYVSYL